MNGHAGQAPEGYVGRRYASPPPPAHQHGGQHGPPPQRQPGGPDAAYAPPSTGHQPPRPPASPPRHPPAGTWPPPGVRLSDTRRSGTGCAVTAIVLAIAVTALPFVFMLILFSASR